MFDMSWGELLVIGGVALVAIGPKDLPKALRTLGQAVGKVRRMAGEFQAQFNEAMREADLEELRKSASDINDAVAPFKSQFDPLKSAGEQLQKAIGVPELPALPALDATQAPAKAKTKEASGKKVPEKKKTAASPKRKVKTGTPAKTARGTGGKAPVEAGSGPSRRGKGEKPAATAVPVTQEVPGGMDSAPSSLPKTATADKKRAERKPRKKPQSGENA